MTENKATQERTPQERLQEEQEHKEHVHHTKINAAAIADHLLGNMHTLHVKLHQYHSYVKEPISLRCMKNLKSCITKMKNGSTNLRSV